MRKPRIQWRLSVAIGLAALLSGATVTTAGTAGEPRRTTVLVETDFSRTTVQITQPSDLRMVLEAICREASIRCRITPEAVELASEITVYPLTLSGSLPEVIARLMKGTKLNYSHLGSGPGEPERLHVEARSPGGHTSEQAVIEARREAHGNQVGVETTISTDSPTASSTLPRPSRPSPEPEDSAQNGSATTEYRAEQTGGSLSSVDPGRMAAERAVWDFIVHGMPTDTVIPAGMIMLPFPDPKGDPILLPATGQPLAVDILPDPQGRPIPLPPAPAGQPTQGPLPE